MSLALVQSRALLGLQAPVAPDQLVSKVQDESTAFSLMPFALVNLFSTPDRLDDCCLKVLSSNFRHLKDVSDKIF